jgi:hypothetical protein
VSNEVLSEQVKGVSGRIDQIDVTLRAVAESLTAFVRLEERHAALIKQVETIVTEMTTHREEDDDRHELIDARIKSVESSLPGLREVRRWVISLVLGVVALVGIGIYNGYMSHERSTTPQPVYSSPGPVER